MVAGEMEDMAIGTKPAERPSVLALVNAAAMGMMVAPLEQCPGWRRNDLRA